MEITGRTIGVNTGPLGAPPKRIIFSTSEDGLGLAVRELQRALGPGLAIAAIGTDIGAIDDPPVSVAALARHCLDEPLIYVTHLTVEVARLGPASPAEIATAAADACAGKASVAVQAWVSGTAPASPGAAATAVTEALRANGICVARAGQEWVLSICLAGETTILGLNRVADSLSDWPGGRMRLGRAPDQISRAEFKLEEALRTFDIALPHAGTAVDFGAAPGGWTRILRAHGLNVIAVDPGDMDPRLAKDGGIRHLRTTAGEYLRGKPPHCDVVVNDMRMDAVMSCELMVAAAARLAPRGVGVLTLKVGSHRVLETIDRCLVALRSAYEVIGARQLHHNRHEVTVALRRRP